MFSASKSKGASGSYQIANSLRFRSSASAYLNRTPASAGNRKTWTFSAWVKRGALGAAYSFFGGWDNSTGATDVGTAIRFNADALDVFDYTNATYNFQLTTTSVFRDPSSWYHVVIAFDTTQATASNRIKVYVNGSQITSFSTATYPNQNTDWKINNTVVQSVGCMGVDNAASQFFDGYMAEINFIDGQALTPSSFGQTNPVTGVWQPKAYSGSYGTNGFKLNFSNGTSTTTLGYDSSGNGNNWTTNNISLTSGSTYDWMIDSPTPFAGSSYGVGNYCVWNPLRPNAAMTYANGNLSATSNGGSGRSAYGTLAMRTGKWYFETTGGDNSIGVSTISETVYALYLASGSYNINGSTISGKSTYTTSDTIGVAYDADLNTIEFFKNNTSQGSTSFSAGSGQDVVAQFNGTASVTRTCVANFGQRPFSYTPPSGFKSLCTFNLPTPTIQNGANHMAATLWTGTGSSQSINNAVNGFSYAPDFVWIKSRSGAGYNHILFDTIRGATKYLSSNATTAETTNTGTLTAFNSNGFTVSFDAEANGSGQTFVGWQWKANGTAVSNTAGSITSQVSANTTAGFSVVTYTGTGANATVGHGLGVAPSMVIVKNRTTAATSWITYHASLPAPATQALYLNTTDSVQTSSLFWNSTAPTSSVFSVAAYNPTNQSTNAIVAYCFAAIAGYSAFGSYTGNGSSDGPFIYTGFRPRYLLIKRTNSISQWWIWDTSRSPYNVMNSALTANASSAETANNADLAIDALSNGFKLRNAYADENASGGTYIYAAFCEVPFNFALGR